ncbi:MAG: endonuclease/exonuclease/phosphatase family protein [Bdellovibrionales bacterium]|nr:endonuclease/exonuclease/phosphatase family protein [Bdellovibrionales bacterium]
MRKFYFFITFLILPFFIGCQSPDSALKKNKSSEYLGLEYKSDWQTQKDDLVFMAFNVENLFDNQHDKGKSDETYLPLPKKQSKAHKKKCEKMAQKKWRHQCLAWDWSDKVVEHKLSVVAESIRQIKNGLGPDILVLEEVENKGILKRLNQKGLHYPTVVLIEGADKRGIDVALMSRLPLVGSASLHPIPFKGIEKAKVEDTRGILQATLKLPNGEKLTVFGVHFPAPFHPTMMREQAFEHLNRLKSRLPKDQLVMAAGDFNVPKREDEKENIVDRQTKEMWIVGHKVMCQTCPGTTYYEPYDSWSFLDMILWSPVLENKEKGWVVLRDSFRMANAYKEQVSKTGGPNSYEMETLSGVSDHWPLAVDLHLKK